MIARLTAAALLAGIALAACAPDFNPPPDYQGGFLWDGGRSRTISVGADDTLYSISRRYDVPVKVIVQRETLPRNANGKIMKNELKKLFEPV